MRKTSHYANMLRRHSSKRDKILHVLRGTATHPSAQWVYDKLKNDIPELSLGTIYRNLGILCEKGEVVRLGVVRGEDRFDADTKPHPHVICTVCAKVIDFPPPDETALRQLSGDSLGYEIDYRRTAFYGICPECKAKLTAQNECIDSETHPAGPGCTDAPAAS